MTETPRETRVLDAVVTLVDSLLDDFDVVDLLTELTERCAAAARRRCRRLPARRPARPAAPAGGHHRAGPRTWNCSNCRPTKVRAWTAIPPANRSPSPTCNAAADALAAVRSRRARRRLRLRARRARCARPASSWARSACSAPDPANSTTPIGSSRRPWPTSRRVAILQEHPPTPVDRDAAAAHGAGQPRHRRAGQGLPARKPRRLRRGGLPAAARLRPHQRRAPDRGVAGG